MSPRLAAAYLRLPKLDSFEHIDHEVEWIHDRLLGGTPTAVLDLGCGPGLHTERLARRGHTWHGIDFGPASIQHAQQVARQESLACSYDLAIEASSTAKSHRL